MPPPSAFSNYQFLFGKPSCRQPSEFSERGHRLSCVLVIALVKRKLIFFFNFSLKKSPKSENRTKTRGFHVCVPCITLSMFYGHETKKMTFGRYLRRIEPNNKRFLYYAPSPKRSLYYAPEWYIKSIPTHENLFAVGKSSPNAAFNIIFLGLGWP